MEYGFKGLLPHHLDELANGSGISEEICRLNFWSIEDARDADELLGRNTDKRWQHSDHLVPCWAVGKPGKGLQIKPDTPVVDAEGKEKKYLAESDRPAEPLFLEGCDWKLIERVRTSPIFITEGAKKAACLISRGYAAISLPGVWNGQLKGTIKPSLKKYCGLGRKIYFAFDMDKPVKPGVIQALERLGAKFLSDGCIVRILSWADDFKGIDDFVVANGDGELKLAIEHAIPFEEWRAIHMPKMQRAKREYAHALKSKSTVKTSAPVQEDDLAKEFCEVGLPKLRHRIQYQVGQLESTKNEIVNCLAGEADPIHRVYVQGGANKWLARILKDFDGISCQRLGIDDLTHVLDAKFEFWKAGKDGEELACNCPTSLSKHVFSSGVWAGIPKLKGILRLPMLRMDGSVTMQPGYDEESGYLLDFKPKKFDLKPEPNMGDAWEALAELRDLLKECSFEDEKSRSAALAMLLTAVSRTAYDFAPLFAINANTPGAGKGALTQLATILATGSDGVGVTTFHPEEVEFKKQLLTTLQTGVPVVSFDNVKHEFGGANIESVLTSREFSGRMLGSNSNGTFSTQVLFIANGNRLKMTLDMSRRTILMTLDIKEENPLTKSYEKELVDFVKQNRGKYVSHCFTILQAYLRERPVIDVKPFNGFRAWSELVRNALLWLEQPDPIPTAEDIFSLDNIEEDRCRLLALMDGWIKHPLLGLNPVTAKDVVLARKDSTFLTEALEEVAKDLKTGQITPRALGYYLTSHKGTRVGNKRIVKAKAKGEHGILWQIEVME